MRKANGIIMAAVLPLVLTACATGPDEEASALAEARQQYQELAAQEEIQNRAPTPLLDAEQALERAADADSATDREHHLYLARQLMETARVVAERKGLETATKALSQEREQLRLSIREQELQQARQRTQELETELAALEAKRTDRGLLVTLDDLFFETDRAKINPGAEEKLNTLSRYLREHPEQAVIVEGHTDSRGPEEYNRELSQQRAEAVKQALVIRGVASERLAARGHGESRPVASNNTSGGRQLNRRVEIVLPDGG
jgi:outer membrane protein OmpA-like peptidoglycan-associated protein